MPDFVHLHVHSHYSLLDAVPQIPALVERAKKMGMSAMALTDYGSMYGIIEFYEACHAAEIKPILGFEAYIAPRGLANPPNTREECYTLVLLAETMEGYKNLLKLASFGHLRGPEGVPCLDKATLAEYHQGIIALSGGIQGEIPRLLRAGERDERVRAVAQEYKTLFGENNFFFELQDHPEIPQQVQVNNTLITMGKELAIPCVVTCDAHYLEPGDNEARNVMVCIREGRTIDEENRLHAMQADWSLKNPKDIASRFQHAKEAIKNTKVIADRCTVEIKLNNWHFPPIPIPEGKTFDEELRDQTYAKIQKLIPNITQEIRDRLDYELGIIKGKGYSPYFLAVADYVNYARTHNIAETTRGSAAGSLVSYAMGITTVNPLYFQLPFERFLNPQRPSAPDVDTDFADDRRDDMIAYVTQKYGTDRVAQIITFGTMMARAAVRDVGRALGYSYGFCDQVAKLIPFGKQGAQMTIKQALQLEPDLKKLYTTNEQVKRLLDIAQKVEGCARHTSIHAAGVVISPTPLTDFTPIQREVGGTRITTQYDMHCVEAAGLLKMDFLGIRNLSILGKAIEIVEQRHGTKIDLYTLPFDDKKTFDMLARGETMGVFQLSSSGMTRYLKELCPTDIFDIMAMISLYRPGPMESIPEYIQCKQHPERVAYIDERLRPILERTFGILVYQDDVMKIAVTIAGYNWEEADKFRKAMGKKIPAEMAAQKIKFIEGAIKNGMSKENANHLWSLIEPFKGYGFNKAHASSYAVVAYQTAYMKARYPVEYMTAVLSAESEHMEKVAAIVHECERMKIRVLPPDVQHSGHDFTIGSVEGRDCIHFGLNAVKNLGEHVARVIVEERSAHGAYKSLEDFLSRIHDKDLNKKSLESLAKCGALDCFQIDRMVLLTNIENLLAFHKHMQQNASSGQVSLFGASDEGSQLKVKLDQSPSATLEDKLGWEKELLGFYLSSHPFKKYMEVYGDIFTPLDEVMGLPRSSWVIAGGVVESVKKKITKTGKVMLFVTLEDLTGPSEMLVFPKTYEATQALWKEGAALAIVGKVPEEEGDSKLFVERAYTLQLSNPQAMRMELGLPATGGAPGYGSSAGAGARGAAEALPPEKRLVVATAVGAQVDGAKLRDLLKKYPGNYRVVIASKETGKKLVTSFYSHPHEDLLAGLGEMFGKENVTLEG